MRQVISDVGEKELIRALIKPLVNPEALPELAGDDCGVFWVSPEVAVLVSTDRVPWDLISFELGLIDIEQLGHYLAVLNISDVAAMGGTPRGLVLNFGLPRDFAVADLERLLRGAKRACEDYGLPILGGDLSDAEQPSLSATITGIGVAGRLLHRSGATPSHRPYCSDTVGLTPTAFAYFRKAKPRGMLLDDQDEALLIGQFARPLARVSLGQRLSAGAAGLTCIDNTDGLAQSLLEISQAGTTGFILDSARIPIHNVTRRVADYLEMDAVSLALEPGADFQLVGSYEGDAPPDESLHTIGTAAGEPGQLYLRHEDETISELVVRGWDYYSAEGETGH